MRVLITGVAGFIGSNTAQAAVSRGWEVVGVDCFSLNYGPDIKRGNVRDLLGSPSFRLLEADLLTADLGAVTGSVDAVLHLAGQPGVRDSWADFDTYIDANVRATKRLLDASLAARNKAFVYASSSSVYGNAARYPVRETDVPRPHSPYGVSKLSGEQLCLAYAHNFALPVMALRYFTVYGPRQRPDMAIYRLIESSLGLSEFKMFGNGDQVRDFTFVTDVVEANLLALAHGALSGQVVNIAGGSSATLSEVVDLVGDLAGRPPSIVASSAQAGDVERTGADVSLASEILNWSPRVGLREGLAAQVAWQRSHR